MLSLIKKPLLILPLAAALCGQAFAAQPALTLKDNDTWVMAGDSITAQRMHTSYIEAFFRTRYPQWHLHFRNSGIGGNKAGNILERFDYDVAAWKPTIVSIELGMNDANVPNPDSKDAPAEYIAGMKKLADNVRAISAQPLFISSSPVNDGSLMESWASVRCRAIHIFTVALVELGQKENVQVVDQYHPLINLWGSNLIMEHAGILASLVRELKPGNKIPQMEALQSFAKAWKDQPAGVHLEGDVHPALVGQYTMAATILAALNVDREVSSATIKPDGTVVAAKYCKITEVVAKDGKLSFTRLDVRSPWPLPPYSAPPALQLMPGIADLSLYTLTIPGLPAGQYRVAMNDQVVATLSHEALEKGWNMSTVLEGKGPLGKRANTIEPLIGELQNPLNNAWRAASKEKNPEKLAAAQKAIEECEAKVQAACQPEPIRFAVEPVK